MATDKNWLMRHNAQTARLNEIAAPAIVANRALLSKIMNTAVAEKQSAKINALVKLLRERLKNRGDFGTYNAVLEIANLYRALNESGKADLNALAPQMQTVLAAVAEKLEIYKTEAGIENFNTQDYEHERQQAKKDNGSEMIGIEHLWAKAIIEIFAELNI